MTLIKPVFLAPITKYAIYLSKRRLHLLKKQLSKSYPERDKYSKPILNDLFMDPVVLKSSMILLPEEFKLRQLRVYGSSADSNYSLVPQYEVCFDKCSVLERLEIYSKILTAKGFTEGFPELSLEQKDSSKDMTVKGKDIEDTNEDSGAESDEDL